MTGRATCSYSPYPMPYPSSPPSTLATVVIAASRHARSGRLAAIGISSASGGTGKKLLSEKLTSASQSGARGLAARRSTLS